MTTLEVTPQLNRAVALARNALSRPAIEGAARNEEALASAPHEEALA